MSCGEESSGSIEAVVVVVAVVLDDDDELLVGLDRVVVDDVRVAYSRCRSFSSSFDLRRSFSA